jgi:hypothetical protein
MKAAVATLYAIAVAVLAGLVFGFLRGQLDSPGAALSLGLGCAVGAYALWSERRVRREKWNVDMWGGAAMVVFALFALRSFLWLAFYSGNGLLVFSPNNLGDFALHLTYVRYIANGAPFWPENPIYAGEPLTYPIGIDLLNAMLSLVGVEVLRGFIWVGLIGSACTAAMLWRWGRGFAVAGFLFAGGTLGFEYLRRFDLVDYQSDAAWSKIGLVVAWKSLPLALFVTQRGFLFAIPAGLALLASWRARFLDRVATDGSPESLSASKAHPLPLWGEVLLYAAMPVFHLHTFLFLSVVAAVWFLFVGSARRHLGLVVALAFAPATALVWCVTGGFHAASMLGWKPGWMQGEQNFFTFWLTNFGAWIPLTLWLLVDAVRRKELRPNLLLILPALGVFLLCCMVKFAPWEWDNTKLMIWSHLLLLPSLWYAFLNHLPAWARGVACLFLFFSGAVSLFGGLSGRSVLEYDQESAAAIAANHGYTVVSRSEMDGASAATRTIPARERFIAHPNYNHPLLLSGRLLVMGYEGHLWSHGIDFGRRKAAVEQILNGDADWRERAAELGARWLFWGEQETMSYSNSTEPWKTECHLEAEGTWGALYDLTRPAKAGAEGGPE